MTTTYARKMAHKAQDGWLNGPGGHAHALEVVEVVINEVIKRCEEVLGPCGHTDCDRFGDYDGCQRLRALAAERWKGPEGEHPSVMDVSERRVSCCENPEAGWYCCVRLGEIRAPERTSDVGRALLAHGAAVPVKEPTRCTCFHAPELHDENGCTVETLMNGPCGCKYDGRRPAVSEGKR